jgi:7-cyano-7-deazaguanine reductase
MFTADRRARSATAVFLGKSTYPNPPFSRVSIERAAPNHRFPCRMLEFSRMSSSTLETFPNPRPERDYQIAINCPEFTSVCPMTGLPDFGEIRITYVPDALCVELKSLKYYMVEFRNKGIYYEHVTNQILDDLVALLQPRRMTVVGDFSVRGGIKTVVTAEYLAGAKV